MSYFYSVASGGITGTEVITGQTLGTLRNDTDLRCGFELLVGASPITVVQLGRWVVSGNSGTHTVRITDVSGNTLTNGTASINTSGATAGQIKYVTLGTPVVLSAATNYCILSDEVNGGDQFYDVDTIITTTAVITPVTGAYSTGEANIGFFGGNPHTYGPVGFTYT